jgi:hypothetical protein
LGISDWGNEKLVVFWFIASRAWFGFCSKLSNIIPQNFGKAKLGRLGKTYRILRITNRQLPNKGGDVN